jgi:hypothetical protein
MVENSTPSGEEQEIERIAAPLRAAESVGEGFDRRVMAEVRATSRTTSTARRWWLEKRTISLRPVTALAMAASIAAVAVFGALQGPRGERSAVTVAAATDTVHLVRFVFIDDSAREVSLVGDFNSWDRDAARLEATAVGGVWSITVPLREGRYEYAFIVDGDRWMADSTTTVRSDEFDIESSVLTVGGQRTS